MSGTINWLNAAGILLDIFGAAWIAKALAFASSEDLIDQSRTGLGSPVIVEALEHQRLDTRCGLALLAFGFIMQFAAVFVPAFPLWIAGGIAVAAVASTLAYYVNTKRREDLSRQRRIGQYLISGHRISDS